jgi:preprotein translocase subunit YajC
MDPMLIIIAIALAAFVFFQFRNSRKRQRETAERQTKIVVGAEVMTNYGLYGTIISLDDDNNMALIESTPGTVLKIHRQTILKVVEPDEPTVPDATAEAAVTEPEVVDVEPVAEPEFGERTQTPAKPTRKPAAKKTRE